MSFRRASLLLPCDHLDDLPTHLAGREAADLLAAWTALWHPALLDATGALPGWHPADNPPDPAELEGELVLLPSSSRRQLAGDWCDRVRAASPSKPLLVEAAASRAQTIAAALRAAELEATNVSADGVADFLALGHAHLQVEMLTRAMHYASVLDTEQFTSATVAAARAVAAGDDELTNLELARAFDLLTDARNHVYAVDFYIVDVTLLAPSTLGEALRTKLASGSPTSVLVTGELLEQMAREEPASLAELRRAIEAGTACAIGGFSHGGGNSWESPETILRELERAQQTARTHLDREIEVFAQFEAVFSPPLPQVLAGMGFRGALHASFDGSRLPKPDQCKTWWGPAGAAIQALAATPLDVARPETWLRFGERVGDTIARDHVATILLAGWPGMASEYYDDLRRAARYGPVLGKLVTLEEYFRVTREPDEWTTFDPREYRFHLGGEPCGQVVDVYRAHVHDMASRVTALLATAVGLNAADRQAGGEGVPDRRVVINPWNFAFPQFVGFDPLNFDEVVPAEQAIALPDVPGCGYASIAATAPPSPMALAEGRTLRNESLELTVSDATGGIQSLRTHRDRSTRISQRLVFYQSGQDEAHETKMVAERLEITRNDAVVGQITSGGRLLDRNDQTLANFTQTMRVVRGLPAAIVDVQLDIERLPEGGIWSSYLASRIAWADDAVALGRGMQWTAQETERERIESLEWVEIDDGIGTVTCFPLGLPFHRQAGPTWLDSLFVVPGETRRRFQFALGIDEKYPTQTALGLIAAGNRRSIELPTAPHSPTGWFLHVGAKNVLVTHVEAFEQPRSGIRLRLQETAGRDTRSTLAAFRPFHAARTTDFRGQPTGVLSVIEGRAEFDIGPYRWIQIEAEW